MNSYLMNKSTAQNIATRLNGTFSKYGNWIPDWCPFRHTWHVITEGYHYYWMDGGIYSTEG